MTLSDEKELIGEPCERIVGAVYGHVLWEHTLENWYEFSLIAAHLVEQPAVTGPQLNP
jgi:hypothetical protein